MLEFLLLCDFAGAVAPDSFREPLRLVLLVVNLIFIGFSFVSGVLPALPKFQTSSTPTQTGPHPKSMSHQVRSTLNLIYSQGARPQTRRNYLKC